MSNSTTTTLFQCYERGYIAIRWHNTRMIIINATRIYGKTFNYLVVCIIVKNYKQGINVNAEQ